MKYALVTGGSRGLGKAICLEIAKMGIPVIINYQSNETAANEVKSMIEAQGGQAELMRFDVSQKEQAEAREAQHEMERVAAEVANTLQGINAQIKALAGAVKKAEGRLAQNQADAPEG